MSGTTKRAFITGIQGFTGRYMAEELVAHGYEVFGCGNKPGDRPGYYRVNLLDPDSLSAVLAEVKPDVVIHLAALAFVGHGNANDFYQTNLIGTRNLLQAIADSGKQPDSVLLASSANVYGNTSSGVLCETTPPSPANDYAVSKIAMEHMASLWSEKLPIVIARPFNYTGVGQEDRFLLPKIVSHFHRKAETIELGNLDVWRDFSDVRSVVQAYRRLVEAKPEAGIVNVCSGQTYSLREIMSKCEALTGHRINIEVNPAFVRANEVKTLSGDASLLKSLVTDWQMIPLEDTLRWMLTD